MSGITNLRKYTDSLPNQGIKMPVLFTSHGNPMDIPVAREDRPFWMKLYHLGKKLKEDYQVQAAVVVSAHWCTPNKTMVNHSVQQKQIYDYYGFPEHFYSPKYTAAGSPVVAQEITRLVSTITETDQWGLDHGAWPMLMHLFPAADVPVFQMSINYNAHPQYHFDLGQQLRSLREKGVLLIGSGSLIHNLGLVMQKMRTGDRSIYGWENDYDDWLKEQLVSRNHKDLINYLESHPLGKLAAPTPDHYVPLLYALGMMDTKDRLEFFYDAAPSIPAFSERSFILQPENN